MEKKKKNSTEELVGEKWDTTYLRWIEEERSRGMKEG